MKKWITLIFMFVLVFAMNVVVYAADFEFEVTDYPYLWNDNIGSYSSAADIYNIYSAYCGKNGYNVQSDNYFIILNRAAHYGRITFFPKNSCIYMSSKYNTNGVLEYNYYAMSKGIDGVITTAIDYHIVKLQSGTAYCYPNSDFHANDVVYYEYCESDYDVLINVPMASSSSNARAYLETGDISYLTNASDYIEIPKPKNVSVYKASSENALYVYYENSAYEVINDFTTRMWGLYRYTDAEGNDVTITDITQQDNAYSSRGQFKVNLTELDTYDTGSVFITLCNRETINDVNIDSEWIFVEYRVGEDTYIIGNYDKANNSVISFEEKVLTDYGTKNNAYTGGVNNSISGIITPSDGNYSFLGGLFNGFGLLGNNGLIAFVSQQLSFIPPEQMVLIGAGLAGMVALALFKLLVK